MGKIDRLSNHLNLNGLWAADTSCVTEAAVEDAAVEDAAVMVRFIPLALLAVPWFWLAGLVAGDALLDLQTKGRTQLDAQLAKSKTCTKDKLMVRKEW